MSQVVACMVQFSVGNYIQNHYFRKTIRSFYKISTCIAFWNEFKLDISKSEQILPNQIFVFILFRSQSQQPLYRTELRRNKLYPSGKNFDDDDRDISGDYLDNDQDNNNSQMFMDRNFSRSHHDLTTTTTSQQHRNYEKEEKKYTSYFAGDNDDYGPKRNNSNGYGNNTQSGPLANGYLGYRSVERSDGWDSPVAWMARSEKVSISPTFYEQIFCQTQSVST